MKMSLTKEERNRHSLKNIGDYSIERRCGSDIVRKVWKYEGPD